MADLFDGYRIGTAWDETFSEPGRARPSYDAILAALRPLGAEELRVRVDALARAFMDRGVTFAYDGQERPFPVDILPRVLTAAEWQLIERGVQQRVRVLEAFLADAYGKGEVFSDGIIPRGVVSSSKHFRREAHGVLPPNGVRVHVSGIDLVRDDAGQFCVLEDNVRTPSGVSYVIENRRALTRVFPEAFATGRVQAVSDYPQQLLAALRAAAPVGVDDPSVVVLTPGIHNSAYFEHALLARLMGVELVEGCDLVCTGKRVRMRTTSGDRPVHVIYRRVDDEFLDPLHFRPDSMLGCPGVLNAARAGAVTIANAVGNGIADDKLIYTYVPELVRYYLDEEPVLPNVETFRLGEPEVREWVVDRLAELVLKPVDGSGGKGLIIGPQADEETLIALRERIEADPRAWIAQRVVALSTVPTLVGDGFGPRHVDLRPFAVNDGDRIWVLPGGLTRVALPEGTLVVNSSRGGGSKDTWVLADHPVPEQRGAVDSEAMDSSLVDGVDGVGADSTESMAAPDPGPTTWNDQQQQQQQVRTITEQPPC